MDEILILAKGTEQNEPELLLAQQKFQRLLNSNPPKAFVVKDKYTGVLGLPISIVEGLLDGFFLGDWTTENIQFQRIENEILVTLTLCVCNPVTGRVRCVTGAAAGQIRTVKPPNDIKNASDRRAWGLDMNNKGVNCLESVFPSIKSMAIKNAAKSLGKIFGRDLNRDNVFERDMEMISEEESLIMQELMSNAEQ